MASCHLKTDDYRVLYKQSPVFSCRYRIGFRPTKKRRNKSMKKITVMSSFPASKKIYVEGSQPDIRVPFREIEQSPTVTSRGEEVNPPIRVYDTSGPYTDDSVQIDIEKGVPSRS